MKEDLIQNKYVREMIMIRNPALSPKYVAFMIKKAVRDGKLDPHKQKWGATYRHLFSVTEVEKWIDSLKFRKK